MVLHMDNSKVCYTNLVTVADLNDLTCEHCKSVVGEILLADGALTCGEAKGYGACSNLKTMEPHTCPFAEEITGDNDTLCHCCDDCQYECAQDI